MAILPSGVRKFRVGGSNFTLFHWKGTPIARAMQVSHTSPQPVAAAVAIQPLDARRPEEIITPQAIGAGTLVVRIVETWGGRVYDQFVENADDLVDVFNAVASDPEPISVTKFVFPPAGSGVNPYHITYKNCVISDVKEGEELEVGTMQLMKDVTIMYTQAVPSDTTLRG